MSISLRIYSKCKQFSEVFTSHPNLDLLFLCFFLVALNVPLWSNRIWLGDYTVMTFFNFYSVYNEFFNFHEIPHWFPFGAYGVSTNYWQFHQLSPACYFVGLLGFVFQVKNVLLLFKLTVLVEELILLIGTFLFCSKAFERRTVRWFVCIATILTLTWFYENFWNMRIYYLIPLTLYTIVLFFEKKDSFFFWVSGCLFVISMIGNLPYYFPFHFLIYWLFALPLFLKDRSAFKHILPKSFQSWALVGLCVIMLMSFYYFFVSSLDGIHIHKEGRDPSQGYATTADNFLNFFVMTWKNQVTQLALANLGERYDAVMYVGLLPIFLGFYGVIRCRKALFYSTFSVFIFLSLFSLGKSGWIASWLYQWFPPIRLFRYLGFTGAVIKFFALLTAGFGLNQLLNDLTALTQRQFLKFSLLGASVLVIAFIGYVTPASFLRGTTDAKLWSSFHIYSIGLFSITLIIILGSILFFKVSERPIRLIVLSALILDLFAGQCFAYSTIFQREQSMNQNIYRVFRYPYQSERAWVPIDDGSRTFKAHAHVFSKPGFWMEAYDFVKFDPCFPTEPTIYEPVGLLELTKAVYEMKDDMPVGTFLLRMNDFAKHSATPVFLRSLGCGIPKARLVSAAIVIGDCEQAKTLIKRIGTIDHVPVICDKEFLKRHSNQLPESDPVDPGTVNVIEFRANQLRLDVHVDNPAGAWLYYADSFDPGWKAWVDGKEVSIAVANLAFKAVHVDSGRHDVIFRFSNGLKAKLIYFIALIGILFCILLAIYTSLVIKTT